MKAAHRFFLAALASLAAGGIGLAQSSGVAPEGPATRHGPFTVCTDPKSNAGCSVETGVRVRAGSRVEVRASGKVNFGGGVAPLSALTLPLGVPPPPGLSGAKIGDAVRDPEGEAATDAAAPAPLLRKNSLLVLVVGARPAGGIAPQGARAGTFYQGGKSTSFIPVEDGEVVLMVNDAWPADNRALCELGRCGWEVKLDVYDPPAAGPVAAPKPAGGASSPAGSDAPPSRTPVSGSQPPQVPTLVTNAGSGPQVATLAINPGAGSPPAQGPPLDSPLGRAGTAVTVPGSGVPSQPPPVAGGSHPDDVPGTKDSPLLPRPPGAVARTYDLKKLDAYQLPLGPAVGSGFARSEKVRGQVTFLVYELGPECSVLDAGEHYAALLRQAGFETLFSCEDAGCGPDYGLNDGMRHPFWSPGYQERHITAVRRGGGSTYASVHVQGDSPTSGRAWVTVVESPPGASIPAGSSSGPTSPSIPPSGGSRQPKEGQGGTGPQDRPAISGSGAAGQAPVSGIGAGAGQATGPQPAAPSVGAAAPPASGSSGAGSRSPTSGVGAAATASGTAPAASQAPASGIGAAASTGSASGAGQQSPAGGVGTAGQGAQSPASGMGAAAPQGSGSTPPAPPPDLTPR